ncbi:MAG: hypothetical protein KDB03_16405 [Planctomycetales bacterium]|nr:hypothetical protein [Planctomycetales bacterium]
MSPVYFNPYLIPIILVIGTFLWLIASAILAGVQRIVKHRDECVLKRMLIDRGLSVAEIERVVHATSFETTLW